MAIFIADGLCYYSSVFDPRDSRFYGPLGDDRLLPFFIYIPITVLALFSLLERFGEKFDFSIQKAPLLMNLAALTTLIWFTGQMRHLAIRLPIEFLIIAKITLVRIVIMSGLLIVVNPKTFLGSLKRFRLAFLVTILANSSSIFYVLLNDRLWIQLAKTTGLIATAILNLCGCKVSLFSHATSITLVHQSFSIQILAPCSGLEGIFFFFFVFSFVLLLDWDLFFNEWCCTIYLFGFLYMFSINTLRIIFFFWIAVHTSQGSGGASAARALIDGFHSNIGWTFYLIGIGIFLTVLYSQAMCSHRQKATETLLLIQQSLADT